METESRGGGFERALAGMPLCALDGDALRPEKARYQQPAEATTSVRREPGVLHVELDEHVDVPVVRDLIATERGCCPSLQLRWDGRARRLSVSVAQARMLPALDAIHAGITGALR
jgi:hypothetical protein